MYQQTNDQAQRQAPPLELLELDVEPATRPGNEPAPERSPRRRWLSIGVGCSVLAALVLAAHLGSRVSPATELPTPVAGAALPVTAPPALPDGLEGFSELFVSAYLTATGPDRQVIIERYYPAASEMSERSAFDRFVTRAVVVDAEPTGSESWQLTVAAEVLAFDGRSYVLDGTHHYTVAVATPQGRPFVATTLPMRVAAPPAGEIPAVVTGVPLTDPGLQSLASGFVRVYTTGGDDLYRYTTAEYQAASISPPPFTRVTIDDLTAVQITPDLVQIRIAGTGTPATGSPLAIEYHLTVVVEAGAWKVAGLAPGPLTAAQLASTETAARTRD